MLELLASGTVSAAALYALLKHGPTAMRTVLREWTRRWLIRCAVKGKTPGERKRAHDLLTSLESTPSVEHGGRQPPDSIEGSNGPTENTSDDDGGEGRDGHTDRL